MTYDKDVKDAIRSTGLVTNEQAWTCSDAVMKLPVWNRLIAIEEALKTYVDGADREGNQSPEVDAARNLLKQP